MALTGRFSKGLLIISEAVRMFNNKALENIPSDPSTI